MFLIILASNIRSQVELQAIAHEMDILCTSWSIDLSDPEKILRLHMFTNNLPEVHALLCRQGFRIRLLNIYHSRCGIEHPLLSGEPLAPAPTFVSYGLALLFAGQGACGPDTEQT